MVKGAKVGAPTALRHTSSQHVGVLLIEHRPPATATSRQDISLAEVFLCCHEPSGMVGMPSAFLVFWSWNVCITVASMSVVVNIPPGHITCGSFSVLPRTKRDGWYAKRLFGFSWSVASMSVVVRVCMCYCHLLPVCSLHQNLCYLPFYISKRSIHFTQVQRSMRAQCDSRFSTMMMMIMMRRASSVHALPGQCSP